MIKQYELDYIIDISKTQTEGKIRKEIDFFNNAEFLNLNVRKNSKTYYYLKLMEHEDCYMFVNFRSYANILMNENKHAKGRIFTVDSYNWDRKYKRESLLDVYKKIIIDEPKTFKYVLKSNYYTIDGIKERILTLMSQGKMKVGGSKNVKNQRY